METIHRKTIRAKAVADLPAGADVAAAKKDIYKKIKAFLRSFYEKPKAPQLHRSVIMAYGLSESRSLKC